MNKIIILLILIACTGCNFHLKVANGMVDLGYINDAFSGVDAQRESTLIKKGDDVEKKSSFSLSTKGD